MRKFNQRRIVSLESKASDEWVTRATARAQFPQNLNLMCKGETRDGEEGRRRTANKRGPAFSRH